MPPHLSSQELLARLVAFDTTSHLSNVPMLDFLCNYLERPGVRLRRLPAEDGEVDKANLLVEIGPPTDPSTRAGLILSGHTDVVPALEPSWTSDPFTLSERDGHLFARGSADMKGFLALATNLVASLDPDRLSAPLVLLFTYDEEVGTLGARQFRESWDLEEHPLPSQAIIGEPTELRVIRVHKGHLKVLVTLKGRSAHSAYPHLGRNAIEPAARLIESLRVLRLELEGQRMDSSIWFPEVPFPSLNIATVEGGSAVNIVPDRCRVGFGVRLLPGLDVESLQKRIRRCVAAAVGDFPHSIETLSLSPPMQLPEPSTLFGDLQKAVIDFDEPSPSEDPPAVSFATDAGWFQELGIDCVLYGPGSIKVAHRPDEFIPIEDLERAARVLAGYSAGKVL